MSVVSEPPHAPYPPLKSALWLMTLLFTGAVIYNVDRLIISVLAEQIRGEIHVTEVQMSLLIGVAYSLLGAIFGVFLGFYIDRSNRRTVLAAALTFWSLATLAGGLSASFGHLFLSRALVGLGEAAMAPAAMSLIADIFPPGKRGRALGLYSIGATVGASLSNLVPGLITGANLQLSFPGVGLLSPWRTTFVLCGLCGPLVALLLFATTREPPRQGVLASAKRSAGAGLAANMSYLGGQAGIFAPYLLSFGLFYMAWLAVVSWTAVFMQRQFHLTLPQVAGGLGLATLVAGVFGYLLGGLIFDARRMRPARRKLVVMAAAPIVSLVSAIAVFAPSVPTALVLLMVISVAAPVINVGNGALVQDMLPNDMRGFMLSICSVLSAVLGVALGPLLVATATEHLFGRADMIGYSMLLVATPALILSSAGYAMSGAALRRHTAKASPVTEVLEAAEAL